MRSANIVVVAHSQVHGKCNCSAAAAAVFFCFFRSSNRIRERIIAIHSFGIMNMHAMRRYVRCTWNFSVNSPIRSWHSFPLLAFNNSTHITREYCGRPKMSVELKHCVHGDGYKWCAARKKWLFALWIAVATWWPQRTFGTRELQSHLLLFLWNCWILLLSFDVSRHTWHLMQPTMICLSHFYRGNNTAHIYSNSKYTINWTEVYCCSPNAFHNTHIYINDNAEIDRGEATK